MLMRLTAVTSPHGLMLEDMSMTTKEQERKALAQICKIVTELDEDSYVGTALDGALELAERNIEYDAAFSARYYIDKLEETEEQLKAANEKVRELEAEMERQQETHHSICETLYAQRISGYAAEAIERLLVDKTEELQQEVRNATARIVESAESPEGANFKNAVSDHKSASQELEQFGSILRQIRKIINGAA